eukprot:UN3257
MCEQGPPPRGGTDKTQLPRLRTAEPAWRLLHLHWHSAERAPGNTHGSAEH